MIDISPLIKKITKNIKLSLEKDNLLLADENSTIETILKENNVTRNIYELFDTNILKSLILG